MLFNTEFIIMGLPSFSHRLCLKQQFLNLVLIYGKPLNARTMDLPTLRLKRDEVGTGGGGEDSARHPPKCGDGGEI